MVAVSNTSPIFNLACIERLHLLHQQFGEVWIPPAVDAELRRIPQDPVSKLVIDARRSRWLRIRPASNAPLIRLLTVELHSGEAEAIALALEMKADELLIDERDGRVAARQLGLSVVGVLGVLLRAKHAGQVNLIKPEIEALRARARFFVDSTLEATILATVGE
jgi:predicted nucleic acid-binding protein